MSKYIYLAIAILIVSCKPDEITFVDPVFHTDTFIVTVTDTFIEFVHDTTRIYCWQDHTERHHPIQFVCDDGYMGPRI